MPARPPKPAKRYVSSQSDQPHLTPDGVTPLWNVQKCEAQLGTVVVGASLRPTWWCADMEGTTRKVVKVVQAGVTFYLDNEDGSGARKVFELGGCMDSHHRDVPVDDPGSFVAAD